MVERVEAAEAGLGLGAESAVDGAAIVREEEDAAIVDRAQVGGAQPVVALVHLDQRRVAQLGHQGAGVELVDPGDVLPVSGPKA